MRPYPANDGKLEHILIKNQLYDNIPQTPR